MTDEPKNAEFDIPIELPYVAADPQCCAGYRVTIRVDENGQHWATHQHRVDCEVWRYVP